MAYRPREARECREGREGREAREAREGREGREGREVREGLPPREVREVREGLPPREVREGREVREAREGLPPREDREGILPREGLPQREDREGLESRDDERTERPQGPLRGTYAHAMSASALRCVGFISYAASVRLMNLCLSCAHVTPLPGACVRAMRSGVRAARYAGMNPRAERATSLTPCASSSGTMRATCAGVIHLYSLNIFFVFFFSFPFSCFRITRTFFLARARCAVAPRRRCAVEPQDFS
jgi:hypothetical protein